MPRVITSLLGLVLLAAAGGTSAGGVGPRLEALLAESEPDAAVAVIIRFADGLDSSELRRAVEETLARRYPDPEQRAARRLAVKRALMVSELRRRAEYPRRLIGAYLELYGERAELASLYAIHAVAGRVPAYLVGEIASLPGVERVTLDAVVAGPKAGVGIGR